MIMPTSTAGKTPEQLAAMTGVGRQLLKDTFSTLAPIALIPAAAGIMGYFMSKKNIKQEIEALKTSYGEIQKMSPAIKKDPNSEERFRELSVIAPVIAKNPKMAMRVLEPRLTGGFSVDDIHKLTMIQSHAQSPSFKASPVSAGATAAGLVADRVFLTLGQQTYNQIQGSADAARKKIRNIQEGNTMSKQSSVEVKLSDECVGEMLADRFVMFKEASAAGGFKASLKAGVSTFGKHLPLFLIPAGIAGGAAVANAAFEKHKKNKEEAAANKAFEAIKKNSEIIKGNPQLANEAFDAIKTFAPSLAVKPQVLKTFIEHTLRTESIAPQTINELANTQGAVSRAKGKGFADSFIGTLGPAFSTTRSLSPNKDELAAIRAETYE